MLGRSAIALPFRALILALRALISMFLGLSLSDDIVRLGLGVAKLTAAAAGFRFFFGSIIQLGRSSDLFLSLVKVCRSS